MFTLILKLCWTLSMQQTNLINSALLIEYMAQTVSSSHNVSGAAEHSNLKNDDVKHNFSTLLARCYVVTSFCNI